MPLVQHIYDVVQSEMPSAGIFLLRLMLAALLGGLIGLERESKHRPAGLRTNLFICVGAAMYTLLSDALAVKFLGDHTRIAAQIIPGIGFIGAGSILHNRNNLVTGITSAATLFVVASVGMAVGGGMYVTAVFGTALIFLCLFLLGNAEQRLNLKLAVHSYEVTGGSVNDMKAEVNCALECIHAMMDNVLVAEQKRVLQLLKQSSVLESVTALGPVQPE